MKKIILTSFVLGAVLLACQKNAITGRRSLDLMPESDMISMSLTEYKSFLDSNKALPATDARTILVRNVGVKIQHAVEKFYADKGLSSELNVNAWCMPGGKVVVYTGLLPVTKDEPSLAIVMGHEIAHAIARHGNERMSQGMIAQLGGLALSAALSQKPALTKAIFNQAYGVTTQLGMLKYSRSHESEADKMGLVFAAMGGYNPEVAITFWERMAAASTGQKPMELLSTHPSDATRIADIKAYMPEAKKYYHPK
jgi:Zn-dependent protease with chaperone function